MIAIYPLMVGCASITLEHHRPLKCASTLLSPSRTSRDADTLPLLFCVKCSWSDPIVGHRGMGTITGRSQQWNCRSSLICDLPTANSVFQLQPLRVAGISNICAGIPISIKAFYNGPKRPTLTV